MTGACRIGGGIALSCAATFVALILVEAGLACFHPVPESLEREGVYVSDACTGYRMLPGFSGAFPNGVPIQINDQGFRDDPAPVVKSGGTFRILLIGDSFTFASQVEQTNGYAHRLEQRLRESLGDGIEIINAGTGGWDPFQYAQFLECRGMDFAPDLILIGWFVGNDTYSALDSTNRFPAIVDGRRIARAVAGRWSTRLKIALSSQFHLARLVLGTGGIEARPRRRCDEFPVKYLALQRQRRSNHLAWTDAQTAASANARRQLERMADMARTRQTAFAVAWLPDETQVNPALARAVIPAGHEAEYDLDMPQSMLATWGGDRSIHAFDLLPAFRADTRCLYLDDSHWNADGHDVAANALAGWLIPLVKSMQAKP